MAFYSYLSTKIIIAFITKSYQDLFGVRSYINAKNYAFLCGERHNIIIFGKINRTDFVQDIKNPSKVAERKQSATSMPCVCCDVHTYGGFLFITIR